MSATTLASSIASGKEEPTVKIDQKASQPQTSPATHLFKATLFTLKLPGRR